MKKVIKRTALSFTADFPGLNAVNIMANDYPIEPFLVFTEFRMDRPVFGPHPHAGISVMTYMLPDSKIGFINRDSNGDHSRIEPGGLHITQAGRGIHHDEIPEKTGVTAHGFQIWVNHADKDRLAEPKALHAAAKEVPEVETADFRVRIVHGSFEGKTPAYKMLTAVTLLHVFLHPGKSIVLPAEEMTFAYGLGGSGESEGTPFSGQCLLNFDTKGDSVRIIAGESGCEFMFGTSMPLGEPIIYGGPFVATTPEQMAETRRRHGRGEMGSLGHYEGH
jgi:redox-sensitive bicupin YhaK (pirin superfamily)